MNATTHLTDIVLESPSAAVIFERHNIDYCCGGKRSLTDACATADLDPMTVLQEINSIADTSGFTTLHPALWDTDLLISYIEQNHHRYLRTVLPSLQSLTARVAQKHGHRFQELHAIAELIDDLNKELLDHLEDEERGVFSAQRNRMSAETIKSEIVLHEQDHDVVGKKLMRLKTITNDFNPPIDACMSHRTSYRLIRELVHDTMQHVFLENAVLFPKLLREQLQ